jgi:Flp pilus assembly protein TadB
MNIPVWTMICILIVFTTLFVRNFFSWIFGLDNYKMHQKRMRQLNFANKKDDEISAFIERISAPADKWLSPRLIIKDRDEVARQLRFTGWDKYFSPEAYMSFDLTLKVAALFMLIFTYFIDALFVGVLWGAILFFGLHFALSNAISSRKEKLFAAFPDFLRITQGFLSSGMPLMSALEKTFRYVNPEWQKLLEDFMVDFNTGSIELALENLKSSTDMFEVREFAVLLKLIIDQGGDLKDGFEAQVDGIKDMQRFLLEKRIAKRKTLAVLIQAPLLICIFIVFGLPLVGDMANIGLF